MDAVFDAGKEFGIKPVGLGLGIRFGVWKWEFFGPVFKLGVKLVRYRFG